MADVFKLEIDSTDLVTATAQLGQVSKSLAAIQSKVKAAQDKLASENLGSLAKAVKNFRRAMDTVSNKFKSSKLGKEFQKMASNVKVLVTGIKAVGSGLSFALSKARNLGLAILGAASAAIYFSKGSVEEAGEKKRQGHTSRLTGKVWDYANQYSGGNFSLSNFSEEINNPTGGFNALAHFGIKKEDVEAIKRKYGMEAAYFHVLKEVQKYAKANGLSGSADSKLWEPHQQALSALFGTSGFTDSKLLLQESGRGSGGDFMRAYASGQKKFKAMGIDDTNMQRVDQASTDLTLILEGLKTKLVDLFSPTLERAIKGVSEGLLRLGTWLNSDEGKKAIDAFKSALIKVAEIVQKLVTTVFAKIALFAHDKGLLKLDDDTVNWLNGISGNTASSRLDKTKKMGVGGALGFLNPLNWNKDMSAHYATMDALSHEEAKQKYMSLQDVARNMFFSGKITDPKMLRDLKEIGGRNTNSYNAANLNSQGYLDSKIIVTIADKTGYNLEATVAAGGR